MIAVLLYATKIDKSASNAFEVLDGLLLLVILKFV